MQLAIFDIDGTLTDTSAMDNRCFERALTEIFGFGETADQWHACPHVSDSGLVQFVFEQQFNRHPNDEEVARLQKHFLALMEKAVIAEPHTAAPISGAVNAFANMLDESNWAVAIATGCWQASAHFKLRQADVPFAQVPLAHCDHHPAREDILTNAVKQAESHYQTSFERVVYIGDALWDVRTTRNLRMPFVGIGADERAARLHDAGASHVLPDYTDYPLFLAALHSAEVPRS
ncbi:MAG: HAD family hydrolase [Acidobacteria bacterium]|nr:HAD family hydrolase [Acidobacteriota bacterium]